MTDGFITSIKKILLEDAGLHEASGVLHLWHNGRKACGGTSHVGGVISLDPHKYAASEPEHRCKRCEVRFQTLRAKFPGYGKPKTDEDAGLSQDGRSGVNAVGGGRVAGLGVNNPDIANQGEPGAHRRRRRDALKTRADRRYSKLIKGGSETIEMSEAGARRFGLGRNDGRLGFIDRPHPAGSVNVKPELSVDGKDPDDLKRRKTSKPPSKRSLKRGPDASIALNPTIPTRFEDVVDEDLPGGITRIDYLIRIGLPRPDAVKRINYYRVAIRDPEVAVKNATYRNYVAEVLEKLLQLIFNDAQLYNRVRALLQKDDHPRGENELPEDTDTDPYERCRFAAWKLAQEDVVTDTWKKVKGGADIRRPPGVSDSDWERHLLAKHSGTVNDKIKKFRVVGNR